MEKAISLANKRFNQGIFLEDLSNDENFEKEAGRQIEFAFINLNAKEIFSDDWYIFSVYCLARKHKRYTLALSKLKQAYDVEEYTKLKKWIKRRIDLLNNENFKEDDFDIGNEISDLRNKVLRL